MLNPVGRPPSLTFFNAQNESKCSENSFTIIRLRAPSNAPTQEGFCLPQFLPLTLYTYKCCPAPRATLTGTLYSPIIGNQPSFADWGLCRGRRRRGGLHTSVAPYVSPARFGAQKYLRCTGMLTPLTREKSAARFRGNAGPPNRRDWQREQPPGRHASFGRRIREVRSSTWNMAQDLQHHPANQH
jgi:hypothetical protein